MTRSVSMAGEAKTLGVLDCVKNEALDVLAPLHSHAADVNTADSSGYHPLLADTDIGYKEIVKRSLTSAADVNATDRSGETLLLAAASNGNEAEVKSLLNRKINVNATNIFGYTSLCAAARNGHKQIVKLLLSHAADVNTADRFGYTPLRAAAGNDNKEIVELLLNYAAEVNTADRCFGHTPLRAAAGNGNKEIVELLLNHAADVNATDRSGYTPLCTAARNGHKQIVKLLLGHAADVNTADHFGYTPLRAAAENGHKKIVILLLSHAADVNTADRSGDTPLRAASGNGLKEIVELLLSHAADVNATNSSGYTPLCAAAGNGHKKIVELLLSHAADVNTADRSGYTPLRASADKGHKEIVKLLLSHAADVNATDRSGDTPLFASAEKGHKKIVILLLSHAADVNTADRSGCTPLCAAAGNGHKEIVEILLSHAADVNTADRSGYTPLRAAAGNGHKEIVELLLSYAADVNTADHSGYTPLRAAAGKGRKEIVEILLSHAADVNTADTDHRYGYTPLRAASEKGHKEIVALLLNHAADVNIADHCSGYTPLRAAAEEGNKEIVELLLSHAAHVNTADSSDSSEGKENGRFTLHEQVGSIESHGSHGYHEAEVSHTGEEGLHRCLLICKKNRNHHNFIPINNFNIEHLPSRYRDNLLVDYVRATSDVTCRLSVSHINEDRPETWPDSDLAFLITAQREEEYLRVGTGWVSYVAKYTEEDSINCECDTCCRPGTYTPKKTWGIVYLRTACHVVFDDNGARHTKCQFFYDSPETDINSVLTLQGLKVVGSDIKGDWCWMMYVTHDMELLDRFDKMCRRWRDLRDKVFTKYRYPFNKSPAACASNAVSDKNAKHDLCIIVSHPHGCSKTVTIGKWTHRELVHKDDSGNEEIKYSYNTPTCPGSGGAAVLTLVENIKLQGGLSHPPALNKGPSGFQEAEMTYTAEVGLHQCIIICEKNPGHRDFISVEDFSIKHLPMRYRDDLIMRFVKATSGIVCRLSVPDISGDSPETHPDSHQPFLNSPMMVGTGWVERVTKFTEEDGENCQCQECCQPGTEIPKKTWGVVYLRTASHVVNTDEVACRTQCHLFYDSHEKKLIDDTVPTLTGFEVLNRDIEGDWCEMRHITHNMVLLDKLHEICERWLDQRFKVHHKYLHNKDPGIGCDTNVKHDLCIIVSHPHGCSKTVTVGKWTQRKLVRKNCSGKDEIQYSYDTPTCPGSSGAPINTLVEDIKLQDGLCHPPAHSQGGAGNDNSSGVGMEQFRLSLA